MSSPPAQVAKIAADLNQIVSLSMQGAAVAAGKAGAKACGEPGVDRFSATYVMAAATCAAIHVLASILGHHGDPSREKVENDEVYKVINPTSTLLAALLAHRMSSEASNEGKTDDAVKVGVNMEFGNEVIFDAIQQVERITGRPVDGWVNPSLLKIVRDEAAGSDEPLKNFLAQHRPTSGGLH